MLLLNYARSLRWLERLDEAAKVAERAYERGKAKGFEVVVNQSLLLRASTYRAQGDVARSAAMLEEVEPRLRQALPSEHPAFAGLLIEQALTAEAGGDLDAALGLIDRASAIAAAARLNGGSAGYAPRALIRRSEIKNAAGQYADAAADARHAIEQLDSDLPRDMLSMWRGDAYLALGRALQAQHQMSQSKSALLEASRQLAGALGPQHPRVELVQRLLDEQS